jgi:hypothetical protein
MASGALDPEQRIAVSLQEIAVCPLALAGRLGDAVGASALATGRLAWAIRSARCLRRAQAWTQRPRKRRASASSSAAQSAAELRRGASASGGEAVRAVARTVLLDPFNATACADGGSAVRERASRHFDSHCLPDQQALLLPSRTEATPLAPLEAMSHGVPWIATPACGAAHD